MPILGLQTGSKLASLKTPLIDPTNLKVIAYQVEGPLLNEQPSFIRTADIRELSDIGMIIDSNDEFIGLDDVILVNQIYQLGFQLVGIRVVDELGNKLGKVSDYSIETKGFIVKQLHVSQGFIKSITETEKIIHRNQIVEISDSAITVRSGTSKIKSIQKPDRLNFVNPFRSSKTQPQPDGTQLN